MSTANELVWKALSNATRRQMLDLLRDGGRSTGEIAGEFPELSRYAVMQHLGVLEEAGLLLVRREGRRRLNYLNPVPIERIYQQWMHPFASRMAKEMLALEQHLESQTEE